MHTLPHLPYEYNALEPVISEQIMRLHHTKHHQGYVDKLNAALEKEPELANKNLVELLQSVDSLPVSVRNQVRNQGGGHYNHSLFWQIMSPHANGAPTEKIAAQLTETYGSVDTFIEQFNDKATKLFGSGWVWLTRDFETIAMPNQDSPLMVGKGEPILGLDVWEHAYYLDFKNKRDEYITNWWKVVDWEAVEKRLANN